MDLIHMGGPDDDYAICVGMLVNMKIYNRTCLLCGFPWTEEDVSKMFVWRSDVVPRPDTSNPEEMKLFEQAFAPGTLTVTEGVFFAVHDFCCEREEWDQIRSTWGVPDVDLWPI